MVGAHSIKGTLFIDGNLAPPDTNMKIQFNGIQETPFTTYEYDIYNDATNFNIGFWDNEGQTADIYVFYNDIWELGYSVVITDQIGYLIEIYIGETPGDWPHAIKGTLYRDGQIEGAGTNITVKFYDGDIYKGSKTEPTFTHDGYFNFNIGFWGHEGQTTYFRVNDETPTGNPSVQITNETYYYTDLYLGALPSYDPCTWIEDKGGPSGLTIMDVFELVDSYLSHTPPPFSASAHNPASKQTLLDPKTIYGVLYIDGVIAPAGINITAEVGGYIKTQQTVDIVGGVNYMLGIEPGHTDETCHLSVFYNGCTYIPIPSTIVLSEENGNGGPCEDRNQAGCTPPCQWYSKYFWEAPSCHTNEQNMLMDYLPFIIAGVGGAIIIVALVARPAPAPAPQYYPPPPKYPYPYPPKY